jgi:pimeloyl-ACP methyl ester carboxylesterase
LPIRSVHGVDLAYEVRGTGGDPAVLVHGSLVDRHTWDLVVPGLAHSMEVIAYDRRGHGESAYAPRPQPVRDDAADLAGLLESLNLYPAHVIAHSYGGAVALRLAIDRPEMVRSLAIHEVPFVGLLTRDPATAPEGEALLAGARQLRELVLRGERARAAQELVGVFSTEPGAWDRLPPEARATFARTVDRWAEEFNDPEALEPELEACRELMVPVLLTVGGQSPRFLHRIAHALAVLLRNSQVVEIADAGHAPQIVRPHQYVGLLSTFLLERNVPVS